MRGLYIHIPFCKSICAYCDFAKTVTFKYEKMQRYIKHLNKEILSYKNKYKDVSTIYIGGGTPNSLPTELLMSLLNTIDLFKNGLNIEEYTIECNPELITDEQCLLFKKYGINRISLGVQSFNDEILKKLGRHHKYNDILKSINTLKKYGFNNINIDLIFSHPFDNLELVKDNLNEFYKLNIPHVSYYSMILEDKTIFANLLKKNKIQLIDEDTSADIYEYIINDLNRHGFIQYEISNFSKLGFESKHNQIYWKDFEYIGCGLNASGYLDNIRYTNSYIFDEYYSNKKEICKLTLNEMKNEFMMLGLRMINGIDINVYNKRFNSDIFKDFNFKKLIDEKLIEISDNNIRLSKKGIFLGNLVFMEFV